MTAIHEIAQKLRAETEIQSDDTMVWAANSLENSAAGRSH